MGKECQVSTWQDTAVWVSSSTWRRGEQLDAAVLSERRAKDDGVPYHALRESHDPPLLTGCTEAEALTTLLTRGVSCCGNGSLRLVQGGGSSVRTLSPLTGTTGNSKWVQSPVLLS